MVLGGRRDRPPSHKEPTTTRDYYSGTVARTSIEVMWWMFYRLAANLNDINATGTTLAMYHCVTSDGGLVKDCVKIRSPR